MQYISIIATLHIFQIFTFKTIPEINLKIIMRTFFRSYNIIIMTQMSSRRVELQKFKSSSREMIKSKQRCFMDLGKPFCLHVFIYAITIMNNSNIN